MNLNPGSKFDIQFIKTTSRSFFISCSHANTISFSSNKLLEILTYFQVKPRSIMASAMKKTLVECEVSSMEGEGMFCATSLEYMMEFGIMSLVTRDIQASSTIVNEQNDDVEMKPSYSVALTDVCVMGGEKLKVCLDQPYLYTVFYWRATGKYKEYMVALKGNDETKVKDIAVCHFETSKWNPKHLSF